MDSTLLCTIIVILIEIVVMTISVYYKCIKDNNIVFNATLLFTIGFFYYWLVPIITMLLIDNIDIEGLSLPKRVFSNINDKILLAYCEISFLNYSAFIVGNCIRNRQVINLKRYLKYKHKLFMARKLIYILNVFIVGICVVFSVLVKDHLFKGYSKELFDGYESGVVADYGPRGQLVAATTVLFLLSLLYSQIRPEKIYFKFPEVSKYFNVYFLLWILFSVFVLSMGGRLYLMSSILALLVYRSCILAKPFKVKNIIVAAMTVCFLLGVYGVIRSYSSVTIEGIMTNLFQESLLTSVSLFAFITDNKIELVNSPIFLGNDLLNLIPSAFFSNKIEYLLKPEDYGYIIYMPLGGLHSFVSFMLNFGTIGSIIVFFIIGLALRLFENRISGVIGAISYSMVCSFLCFSFFRDPFSVSLIKNILEFSIIMPFIVWQFILLISAVLKSTNRVQTD